MALHEFDLDRVKSDIVQVKELIARYQALLDADPQGPQADTYRDKLIELRQELALLNSYLA